jgi:hypothetical protein
MKLLFLGTGAADWKPEHRENPEYRRNASALVDGTLLIDPGPCVPDALSALGIPMGQIKYVLNTHRHRDHFHRDTLAALQAAGAEFVEFSDAAPRRIGAYDVTPLRGNHATEVWHFLISDGVSTLFYGLDAAWLLYEEFQAIKAAMPDLAVLDATLGFVDGDYRVFEHNNLHMVLQQKASLAPYVKRFCISHMARKLHLAHEWVTAQMRPHGIEVAYDGLELEF